MLNEKQQLTVDSILNNTKGIKYITSAPGCGKTYCVNTIISEIRKKYGPELLISACATSHKATKLLGDSIDDPLTDVLTIHSFGGFLLKQADGKDKLVESTVRLQCVNLLVIDEVSMLTKQIWDKVKTLSQFIILLGDKNQLPAVEDPIDLHKENNIEIFELTQQMRQTDLDSNLYKSINQFRECIESTNYIDVKLPQSDASVTIINDKATFIHKYNTMGLNTSKLLVGYTNKAVDSYVEDYLHFHNRDVIQAGDIIVAQSPLLDEDGQITITNGTELIVLDRQPHPEKRGLIILTLRDIVTDRIHNDVVAPKVCSRFKAHLKKMASEILYGPRSKMDWKRVYYPLKNRTFVYRISLFSTVHKAQGSTYDTVYIDYDDIMKCRDLEVRAKLLYVAFSRAKQNVVLYVNKD